jgi:hypothetical protein
MKISVHSQARGNAPCRLCLGRSSLQVAAVLRHHDGGDFQTYHVRVLDGRRFVVRRQTGPEQWELVAVYGRTARPVLRNRGSSTAPFSLPGPAVFLLKAIHLLRRAAWWRHQPILTASH